MSAATFVARSRAAWARLGASLTERIPWSVQFSEQMNMGMRSSVRLIAKIDARGGVAGGRWNVKGCRDAKKRAISREIVPADGISAASNKRLRHGPVGSSSIRLLRRRCVRKGRVRDAAPLAAVFRT